MEATIADSMFYLFLILPIFHFFLCYSTYLPP